MSNKRKDEKQGFFSKIKRFVFRIRDTLRNNQVYSKTFGLVLCLSLLIVGIGGGFIHKKRHDKKQALTVSDTHQEIEFSKTGNEVKLKPQKRYKDMTVIPLKFNGVENQSLNAKDYILGIMPQKHKSLPKNLSASIASFSSNGEMALVLKGDLPKEPLQLILQNQKNFSESDDGSGEITIWGKKTKVKDNDVAFTVNPRGNNVKKDKRIASDMRMKDLYSTTFGDAKYKKLKAEQKKANQKLNKYKSKKDEAKRQIKQLNKGLDRKEDDYKYDNITSTDDDTSSYESQLDDNNYKNIDDTDLSSSDLESVRNSKITELESVEDDIDKQKENLDGIENKRKELDSAISKMYKLTTTSNRYQFMDPK